MSEPAKPKLSIFGEFREFIARGNVIDLAVGVIIGAAFNDIVKGLVDNVVMPPIGLLLSGVDFSQMKLVLKAADPAKKAAEVAIQYGLFFNTLIKFVIVAWVVFLLVKGVNAIRRRDAESPPKPAPAPTPQEALLTEIRDLLKDRRPADSA
ncbi:MAG TPA: large-conductance mechanosensitive channel protein MscL [Phenylobacterium sp.]|jgi:large conductance mechanosensitive channel|uniref:large-conductance mechanosensitive channel protein MscL n=1 Tax=Phenylobacterium sp. TaxID=1871053 RepID=UPI002C00EE28|nr:large-conductance mechanosensitive channel protein MscL [Phenylobacterium sp.]HXA38618.1 large-conductance mechanosensitive channel protein MscL [Phenylobacterium sp.]